MKKILIMVIAAILLTGCSTQIEEQHTEEPQKIVETVPPTETVQKLADGSEFVLQFPDELSEYVIREQSTYGPATTETFYIKNGDNPIPLFRIDIGDRELGDWLGVLETENGDLPVTYTVFAVAEEDKIALGENAEELYANLMNGFNVMLDGIINDPRFAFEKTIEIGDKQSISMKYWTVNLPENMWVEEKIENGNYEAVFFSNIQGEDIALYTVSIGDVMAETELGLLTIDGVQKPVSVGSFDLPEKPEWSEDDYAVAYQMMNTINDVIKQIETSELFSEKTE